MAGVENAVQIHIERGDNLNARDAGGMTPLMLSADRNKPAICKLLLYAGADHGLLDPSGRTALQIAIAAGSEATASILAAVSAQRLSFPPSDIALDSNPMPELAFEIFAADSVVEVFTTVQPEARTAQTESQNLAALSVQEPCLPLAGFIDAMYDREFDLTGWEAEKEPIQPEIDLVILDSASAVQVAITTHEPIDASTEWDDIDVYLPEVALPLARADDIEGRVRLRLLLLRAIREGSVPALDVSAQSTNEDRSANPEAKAYLELVINDLGAEVDERFEYSDASESFAVFVNPEETLDEEATLDEALMAIDRAASPRHEPLRIYQREFRHLRLLTAEEEVQLAKEMEAALEAALDSLATWPDGISRTLAAGADVLAGSRPLSSIWVGGEPDSEPATDENVETDAPAPAKFEEAVDENEELADDRPANAGDATFDNMLRKLAALVDREGGPRASFQEIRQAIAGLRLDRRFLLELIDAANGPAPCLGFRNAMADFRKARDWMAAANLKLSFFHAKKYLYSGEPLDDLAQEGNIGLLKAVDRYDWRRGFRFSTYATWWIRQQISRYVADKARTIRVPVHVHEKQQRVERLAQIHEKAVGQKPTLDELAEQIEMPRHKLVALLRIAPEPISIDMENIDDMIAIEDCDAYTSPDPADNVDKAQLKQAIDRFISFPSTQNRKEEQILRMRFGIGIAESLTLDEIGIRFEVTRERIRQVETESLRKLKYPSRSEPFARTVLGWQPENKHLNPDSQKPTALDFLLNRATEIGALVEDGRKTASGRIWVNLAGVTGGLHQKLARKLVEFGFEHWPGQGYWK